MPRKYSYRLGRPALRDSGHWECEYVILDGNGACVDENGLCKSSSSAEDAWASADFSARKQVAALTARSLAPV